MTENWINCENLPIHTLYRFAFLWHRHHLVAKQLKFDPVLSYLSYLANLKGFMLWRATKHRIVGFNHSNVRFLFFVILICCELISHKNVPFIYFIKYIFERKLL